MRRLLPERVHIWFPAFFDYLRKPCRFGFENFHLEIVGIPQQREAVRSLECRRTGPAAAGRRAGKSPPENYGKENQTTVAAFLPWRGS